MKSAMFSRKKRTQRISAESRRRLQSRSLCSCIREAEQGAIFEEYSDKEYEVLTAIVQRVEKNGVYVELGKTDGIIPFNEVIVGENYAPNDHIKVYVLKIQRDTKGPQIIVSRTHPGLVKRLFELEVPEIQSGVVQIKSVAREAGQRTKIAVASFDPQVVPSVHASDNAAQGSKTSSTSSITKKWTSSSGIPTLRFISQRHSVPQRF